MSEILGVLLKYGCIIGANTLDDPNAECCYDVAVQAERMLDVCEVLEKHGRLHETNYYSPFYISDTSGVRIKIIPMDAESYRACILSANVMQSTFDMLVSAAKMALTYK